MTTEDLTALQALLAKMTPGEWQWRYDALWTDYPQWSIQPGILIADGTDGTPGGDMIDKANAAGIVALVNAAPALIASAARAAELEAEVAKLSSIVRAWHYLAVGPDEMGDYFTHKQLVKISEPYASPALKALEQKQ